VKSELQWGGRFAAAPDEALLRFGSSLEDDLVLAPFDVACSRAHVAALLGGKVIDSTTAAELDAALAHVAQEIEDGSFARYARETNSEDVHGAIDQRVRDFAPRAGASLHTGRSRNDQVATTLLLYVRARAEEAKQEAAHATHYLLERAEAALKTGAMVAATTHWQPAQPILLAFWLGAAAEMMLRNTRRFDRVGTDASRFSPLGSGACSGSTLPIARDVSAARLGFAAPSRIALDAVGNRDAAVDLLHAISRALVDASRVSEEIVLWATPAFGYVRLDDAASTGSSLMPQKRNPDPFELVRAHASGAVGTLTAALGSMSGIALSYHRDLQETKSHVLRGVERGLGALRAFRLALPYVHFNEDVMSAHAGDGYTVATDLADALIRAGATAREAHEAIGTQVARAEAEKRPLNVSDLAAIEAAVGRSITGAPLDAKASIEAKVTSGSTAPAQVVKALASMRAELAAIEEHCCGSAPR
jgi:argininosuccinate lyase